MLKAGIQRNYEHMQKQERTREILITHYAVVKCLLFFFICI